MDLSYKTTNHFGVTSSGGEEGQQIDVLPATTLRGAAATEVGSHCEVGDTFTATVTFKVIEHSERGESSQPYGGDADSRVELELVSMDYGGKTKKATKDASAEDAVDGYLATKRSKQEAGED
jgi:hypothetical protein